LEVCKERVGDRCDVARERVGTCGREVREGAGNPEGVKVTRGRGRERGGKKAGKEGGGRGKEEKVARRSSACEWGCPVSHPLLYGLKGSWIPH